jgi:hypothetical protein
MGEQFTPEIPLTDSNSNSDLRNLSNSNSGNGQLGNSGNSGNSKLGNNGHKPGTFVKGDVRINRKGRPKTFDEWRQLVQDILQEPAVETDNRGVPKANGKFTLIQVPEIGSDGQPVLDNNGRPKMIDHYATNAELLARKWLVSSKRQQDLVDAGFGKVPTAVDITSGGQSLMRQLPDDEKMRRLETLTKKALGAPSDIIDAKVIHSADEVDSGEPSADTQDAKSDDAHSDS